MRFAFVSYCFDSYKCFIHRPAIGNDMACGYLQIHLEDERFSVVEGLWTKRGRAQLLRAL